MPVISCTNSDSVYILDEMPRAHEPLSFVLPRKLAKWPKSITKVHHVACNNYSIRCRQNK